MGKTTIQACIQTAACIAALVTWWALPIRAETYPNGPITLVNPYAAGGPADVLARTIITPMADLLGQSVVILNKPGGATAIAAAFVAASAPDGQTVLMSSASSHIVTPALTKVSYDGMHDFAFVCMIAAVPNVLVVRSGLPVKTVPELVALAKGAPGKLNYASVGIGSPGHIAGELFKLKTGVDIVHVPYKGGGPAVVDTIGGQVQLLFVSMPAAWQYVKAGKLKAIAVTSAKRSIAAPDVPTVAESGIPDYVVDSWYGALVPAKTSPSVVTRLNAAFAKVLDNPRIKERLLAQGAEAAPSTPADFDRRIKEELVKWEMVIRAARIRPE